MRGELKLYWVLGALLLSFVLFVTAGDVIISLSIGTPQNGSIIQGDSIFVNASANTSSGNVSLFLDFNNSLVSWWRMDDANSTHVFDYLGRNNGTIVNALQTDLGYMGKGFSFDGNGDYINVTLSSQLNTSSGTQWTISAWINSNSLSSDYHYIITNRDGGGVVRGGLSLQRYGNGISFHAINSSGSSKYSTTGPILTINSWHHVVGIYNGTSTLIYFDGSLKDFDSAVFGGLSYTKNPWRIGDEEYAGLTSWNGTIDDVMIFNRGLSALEIQVLYANQSTKYLERNLTNLPEEAAYYTLYAQDTSGNVTSSVQAVTLDNTAPSIEINSPLNQTYTSSPIVFNISVTDINPLSGCWYLIGSGGVNFSMTNASSIYTASYSLLDNGDYSAVFYCNDSAGNLNSTASVSFSVDIPIIPFTNIDYPTNMTYSSNVTRINYVSANASFCWYSTNGGVANSSSVSAGTNFTGLNLGNSSLTVYCNSSDGSVNSSNVIFTVINTFIPPITSPLTTSSGGLGQAPTYSPTRELLSQGYKISAGVNFKVNFDIGTTKHQLKVNSINNESVNITIYSDPITFILNVGQIKKVDVNFDGIYDLSVLLKSISGGRVNLIITSISETYGQDDTGTNRTNDSPSIENMGDRTEEPSQGKQRELTKYFIAGVLALFMAVIGLYFYIRRRKEKKNYLNPSGYLLSITLCT